MLPPDDTHDPTRDDSAARSMWSELRRPEPGPDFAPGVMHRLGVAGASTPAARRRRLQRRLAKATILGLAVTAAVLLKPTIPYK